MAITIKNEEQIELMRRAGQILARVHKELAGELHEGMTTRDVDRLVEEMILSFGGYPNFKGYQGFPTAACVSVNDEIVHGIPSDERVLRNGDIVSVDTGVLYKGYHSDAARTHAIGEISKEASKLIRVTEDSFFEAVKKVKPGNHIADIGQEVQRIALGNGYSVVRTLTGHGIGTDLHEAPNIPNYKTFFKGPRLRKGMTLAIEPMINMGNYDVVLLDNDWTYATADGSLSSHYENTVAVTENGYEILTLTPEELAMRTGGGQEADRVKGHKAAGGGEKGKASGGKTEQSLKPTEEINQELARVPELFGTAAPAQEQETIVIPAAGKNRSSKVSDEAGREEKAVSSKASGEAGRAEKAVPAKVSDEAGREEKAVPTKASGEAGKAEKALPSKTDGAEAEKEQEAVSSEMTGEKTGKKGAGTSKKSGGRSKTEEAFSLKRKRETGQGGDKSGRREKTDPDAEEAGKADEKTGKKPGAAQTGKEGDKESGLHPENSRSAKGHPEGRGPKDRKVPYHTLSAEEKRIRRDSLFEDD